jgi:hypothetical protein
MTRIDYAKPKMFQHPQGPTLDYLTTTCAIAIYPLLGFSQTSGISHSALTRLGTRTLLGFVPFQRHNHCDATNETSLSPLPAPRFSQPSSRSNALVDLQVYSTPQALLGLRSSKLHTDTISTRHPRQIAPSPLPHPSWLPSTNRPVFPRTSAVEDYPFLRLSQFMAPRSLSRTGFHLGL